MDTLNRLYFSFCTLIGAKFGSETGFTTFFEFDPLDESGLISNGPQSGLISIGGSTVAQISLGLENVTVQDVINEFGNPTHITGDNGQPKNT